MDWIFKPWPWYISGPMIAFIMFLLLLTGKRFGMSSNLRTMCTICGAGKTTSFFRFDWKKQTWNLLVVLGTIIGGYIAANYLSHGDVVNISDEVVTNLNNLGFNSAGKTYLPEELFGGTAITNGKSLLLLIIGGFLVGFGARYAGGCTSGHAISGLSNLQVPSLIAVLGFFAGGLVMIHLIFPLLF